MKITLFALFVLLPSLCVCTPLPDFSAAANSGSNASVNASGNNISANANSNSNASVNTTTPPAVPPTTTVPPTSSSPTSTSVDVNANSSSNANVNQQGGSGGKVDVNASSSSSASVTVSGNKCGKPDVDGFNNYSVLIKNQGDLQKVTSINWMVWKSSSSSTRIETDESVCAPRYLDQNCKASQYKITVQSETDILYEVWGYNGQKVLYIKQKLDVTSQQFHIYTSQVVSIAEAASGSQEVVAVKNEQSIKEYFDNGPFAILDTDYKTYMIGTTSGQNSVTFISLSQEVYESNDLKAQVSQKIEQVLQVNNLQSANFVEVSSKFDVDITQYKWDQYSQGDNNGSPGGNTSVNAGSNSSADVNVQNKGNNGSPSADVKAHSDSSADAVVRDKGNTKDQTNANAKSNSDANVSVNGSSSGSSGKPSQQGFTNYSVLKISNEEFKTQIDKITWYVAKYTQVTEEVKSDVTVCADRYVCSNCLAVKFQYTSEDGSFVFKEWGYDGQNLIYIQEKISFVTQDFVILKAQVENVMKATKDSNTAIGVQNADQVKTYLSSEYAVLGTDYKNFFIGQTSSDKGSITFVAYIQEIYECEEKQQQYAQQITQILQANGIDESKLQKLTQKFDVDTNKYNKSSTETDVSSDGSKTTTKQETEHAGDKGKTETETTVINPPGGGGASDVNVSSSSNSNANVNANNGGGNPPSTPTSVKVNSSSDSNVSVNGPTSGNISANSSSDANASVQNGNATP